MEQKCKFLLIASGEDDLGNSIGATLYGFSLSLTGGATGHWHDEDSLKIVRDSSICLNTEDQLNIENTCTSGVEIAIVDLTGGVLQIDNVTGWTITPILGLTWII